MITVDVRTAQLGTEVHPSRLGVSVVVAAFLASALLSRWEVISGGLLLCGLLYGYLLLPRTLVGPWTRGVAVAPVVLVLLAVYVGSGMLAGTIDPTREFVTHEGRQLIALSILPLFAAAPPISPTHARRILGAAAGVTALGIALYVLPSPFRALVVPTASVEPGERLRTGVFWGFGSSHHVTGYALAALAFTSWAFRKRLATPWWYVAVFAAGSALTTSRTTLLAILIVPLIVIVTKATQRMSGYRSSAGLPHAAAACFCAGVAALALAIGWHTISAAVDLPTIEQLQQSLSSEQSGDLVTTASNFESNRQANVALRVDAWSRAVHDGVSSPLFGTGAFRFNDDGKSYLRIPPIVRFSTSATHVEQGDFDAHNVYLQMFSEFGIIGMALLVGIQVRLSKWFLSQAMPRGPMLGLVGLIWGTGLASTGVLAPSLAVVLVVVSWLLNAADGTPPVGGPPDVVHLAGAE